MEFFTICQILVFFLKFYRPKGIVGDVGPIGLTGIQGVKGDKVTYFMNLMFIDNLFHDLFKSGRSWSER